MSMNISLSASLKGTFTSDDNKIVKPYNILHYFDCWQTPTKVTYEILESEDPKKTYIDWIISVSVDREINIYAEDDIFNLKPPIGTEIYNPAKGHIKELEEFLEDYKDYQIEWFMI